MRFKDIIWITSLLGLFYLHALALERSGQGRNITLKMVVLQEGNEKVVEKQYNSFDALQSDSLWTEYDIELQLPDAPDSTGSSLYNIAFNTYISTWKDTAEAKGASGRRKIIIEKK